MPQKRKRTWQDLPMVEIIWTDAAINTDHEAVLNDGSSESKFGGLVQCRDIGYLISKGRTEVKLAVSLCPEDGSYRHSNTIPRGWIKQIIILSRPPQLEAIKEEPDAQAQEAAT